MAGLCNLGYRELEDIHAIPSTMEKRMAIRISFRALQLLRVLLTPEPNGHIPPHAVKAALDAIDRAFKDLEEIGR